MNLVYGIARMAAGYTGAARVTVNLPRVIKRFWMHGYVIRNTPVTVGAIARAVLGGKADFLAKGAVSVGSHVVAVGAGAFVDVGDGICFVVEVTGAGAIGYGLVNLTGMVVFMLVIAEVVIAMALAAIAVGRRRVEGGPCWWVLAERGVDIGCFQGWRAACRMAGVAVKLMDILYDFGLVVAAAASGKPGDKPIVVWIVRFESLGDGVAGGAIRTVVMYSQGAIVAPVVGLGVADLADGLGGGAACAVGQAILRVEKFYTLCPAVGGRDAGLDQLAINDAEIAAGIFGGVDRIAAALHSDCPLAVTARSVGNRDGGRGADDFVGLFASCVAKREEQAPVCIARFLAPSLSVLPWGFGRRIGESDGGGPVSVVGNSADGAFYQVEAASQGAISKGGAGGEPVYLRLEVRVVTVNTLGAPVA